MLNKLALVRGVKGLAPMPYRAQVIKDKVISKTSQRRHTEKYVKQTRRSTNPYHSWNGGDYNEYVIYQDDFWWSDSSCEIEPEDDFHVGYLYGVPVLIKYWHFYGNPSGQIHFKDGDYFDISPQDWKYIQPHFQEIGFSRWGVGFVD